MRRLPTLELLPSPSMATRVRVSLLVACLVAVGCGASNPAPKESPLVLAPIDLYPLRPGNAWSYDVDTGEASSTLGLTRVEAVQGSIATVRTGQQTVKYDIRQEGINVVSEEAWLFRTPLEEGSSWPARGGRIGRFVSTEASVETPAGRFTGCLEVVETGGKLELEVRTIYCPFVGPVAVDSTMRSSTSDRSVSAHARLRGYDVDGGAALTP